MKTHFSTLYQFKQIFLMAPLEPMVRWSFPAKFQEGGRGVDVKGPVPVPPPPV